MTLPPDLTNYIAHILPHTEGWCSQEKAYALASHVLEHRPKCCVEIGVFAGRSLYAIALALRTNKLGHILGIDPWNPVDSIAGFESDPPNRDWWSKCDHSYIYKEFLRKLHLLDLEAYVDVFTGTSAQAMCIFNLIRNRFSTRFIDLLHIDGNHSEAQALYDVNNYVPLVSEGGYVFFDDCDWGTTKRAQARLAELCDSVSMVGNCGCFKVKE